MKLKIEIRTDNAAFYETTSGDECARLLRKLADRIAGEDIAPGDVAPCLDFNGNRVGEARVTL